jgi:hypothetical protein
VSFEHAVHLAAGTGIACRDCHGAGVSMTRDRTCQSCHDSHHAGRAECSACHAVPARGAHDATAHLSCSGGTCHAPAKAPSPVSSRSVCLFCHAAQRDHEPGGNCALCHRIPGAKPPNGATGRGAQR